MRLRILGALVLGSISLALSAQSKASEDVYQRIYASVDRAHLLSQLKSMAGVLPVTVKGETFLISERFSPKGKEKFRAYWKAELMDLGMDVQELAYPTVHHKLTGENEGHNLEAVLPGRSKDSVVIVVHYDSRARDADLLKNPAADDDMSGMSILLEAARILKVYQQRLRYTVRFVATDYEEWGGLEGAYRYVGYLKELAKAENFKIIGAIDYEQTGWGCVREGKCDADEKDTVDVFSCSTFPWIYSYPWIQDIFDEVAKNYSPMQVKHDCMDMNSDHYEFWTKDIPAFVIAEHKWVRNPYFDDHDDTYEHIDEDYYFKIAQVAVTFTAKFVGVE